MKMYVIKTSPYVLCDIVLVIKVKSCTHLYIHIFIFSFTGRIAPTDLNVIPESPYSLCYQVTENFKGYCERIKRIEIEAERDGCSSISVHVVASVPLSNDGTFEATTKPLQESSTYQLRAVAVYNDAVLGRGEFKAHNEKLVITIDGQGT